jgi:hypothetical protein
MRKYLYHSHDPLFPGSIEQQKQQFPDAVWFPTPGNVQQASGKFQGSGGRLLGVMPNGDQVQEHLGVLVTIAMSEETWDEKGFDMDMARVRRARYLRANRRERKPQDLTPRILGEAK